MSYANTYQRLEYSHRPALVEVREGDALYTNETAPVRLGELLAFARNAQIEEGGLGTRRRRDDDDRRRVVVVRRLEDAPNGRVRERARDAIA